MIKIYTPSNQSNIERIVVNHGFTPWGDQQLVIKAGDFCRRNWYGKKIYHQHDVYLASDLYIDEVMAKEEGLDNHIIFGEDKVIYEKPYIHITYVSGKVDMIHFDSIEEAEERFNKLNKELNLIFIDGRSTF